MARSRRKFTAEFKREAARLAELPDGNVSQVARDLGLDPSVLRRWIREMHVGTWEPTPGKPLKSAQQQEIEALRREPAKVKTERDILKKRSDTLPRTRHEVSVHCPARGRLVGQRLMLGAGRVTQRFLSGMSGRLVIESGPTSG